MWFRNTWVAAGLCLLPLSSAFYLPGVAPHDYKKGEAVTLNVNSLSPNQQGKSVISYDYYYKQLHFCKPKDGTQEKAESIGSILFGDRIFNSAFEVKMNIKIVFKAKTKNTTS
jgi:transmembrane 9 superfamily protein 2/4